MPSESINSSIDLGIRQLVSIEKKELEKLEIDSLNRKIPIIEREVVQFIKFLLDLHQPKRILELGSAVGYSALTMKDFLPTAEITSIELDETRFLEACENSKKLNLEVEFLKGDCLDYLEKFIENEEKFDFIFIDAAKGQYEKYFHSSDQLISKNGLIVCDNVLFKGLVFNKQALSTRHRYKTIVTRLNRFLKDLMNRTDYLTTIIPLEDGLSLSIKK